jgi:hypothetical protein
MTLSAGFSLAGASGFVLGAFAATPADAAAKAPDVVVGGAPVTAGATGWSVLACVAA